MNACMKKGAHVRIKHGHGTGGEVGQTGIALLTANQGQHSLGDFLLQSSPLPKAEAKTRLSSC